jgi:PAS domain S-box-containing protein
MDTRATSTGQGKNPRSEGRGAVENQAPALFLPAVDPLRFEMRAADFDAQARLAAIIQFSDDAIIGKTLDGTITSWNPAAERLFGYTAEEAVGHSIVILFPPERAADEGRLLASILRGDRVSRFETTRLCKNGSVIDVDVTVSPIRDRDGRVVGASKIVRDITARKEDERRVAAAIEAAKTANRAKAEFLASASHELRTPLNAIIGFSQLLQLEMSGPLSERQRNYVRIVERSGENLLRLVGDMLEFAKIDAGELRVVIEPVAVHDVLEEFISLLRPLVKDRGLALALPPPPPNLAAVRTDRTRLQQILLNFGTNAVKYNRASGAVGIRVTRNAGGTVRIAVEDTGIGIPAEKQSALFQPFNRLGAEHKAIEGSGLGLSIAERLARRMGAALGFTSKAGVGSVFWIDLEECADAPCPKTRPAVAPVEPLQGDLSQVSVLYVEDDKAAQTLMQQIADGAGGVRLLLASTGSRAQSLARIHHPDLVILDMHLPDTSGIELFMALRRRAELADTEYVALSADALSDSIERARVAGIAAYLTKPYSVEEMLALIRRAQIRKSQRSSQQSS